MIRCGDFWLCLHLAFLPSLHAGVPAGSIEDFIDSEMPASGVPGLAYAVVADGEITAVGARGVVKIGGDRDVTPDTPFLTGSISKSFTALAVMQLVEAGEVDLDAEVSQYLDGFAGRPGGAITVRQLLSHTSGFSTLQGNTSHTDAAGGTDELARRVDGLAEMKPCLRTRRTVGVLERQLPDPRPPDRSRQRAGLPGLRHSQHPGTGRYGAQLRRRR